MTFDELCDQFQLTPSEREELWWYLVFLRVKEVLKGLELRRKTDARNAERK